MRSLITWVYLWLAIIISICITTHLTIFWITHWPYRVTHGPNIWWMLTQPWWPAQTHGVPCPNCQFRLKISEISLNYISICFFKKISNDRKHMWEMRKNPYTQFIFSNVFNFIQMGCVIDCKTKIRMAVTAPTLHFARLTLGLLLATNNMEWPFEKQIFSSHCS